MKKITFLIQVIFIGCFSTPTEQELLNKSNPNGIYGEKITLSEKQKINALILNEEKYLDENVFISGKIIEVCPMRGCWVKINDKSSNYNLRIKVTDGDIVFPLSAKGKQADIQGVFTKLEFSEDQARKWKMHLAEEKGIKLNLDEIVLDPSDLFEFRVNAHGTKIY
ncbi:MAG: hypothetical protein CBD21_04505 [bacterium TMED161]|nr:MAG: hypothetical protein CBD21_04505 [bacterium TMED161]